MTVSTIVINSAPYGDEKAWNALRLADLLLRKDVVVNLFLLADGIAVAKKGQKTPAGHYNLEQMLDDLVKRGATVRACKTCAMARGIKEEELVEGVKITGMLDLANWVKESQNVLTF